MHIVYIFPKGRQEQHLLQPAIFLIFALTFMEAKIQKTYS